MMKLFIKIRPLYRFLKYLGRAIKGVDEKSMAVSKDELIFLLETFGKRKEIIEVGCARGQTTKRLAKYNQVIAIDPFIPDKDGLLMGTYIEDFYKTFLKNIANKNVIFYNMTSMDAFKIWDKKVKRKVDGIFIDAVHTYEAVKEDSQWIKYIKTGGLIAFHDVAYHNGVRHFVEGFIVPKHKLVGKVRSLWIFKKK